MMKRRDLIKKLKENNMQPEFYKKINILGMTYNLVTVDCLSSTDWYGFFDGKNKYILLQRDLSPEEFKRVLIHEINHAILHESSMYCTDLSEQIEEIIVNQIAVVLTQLFNMDFLGE